MHKDKEDSYLQNVIGVTLASSHLLLDMLCKVIFRIASAY